MIPRARAARPDPHRSRPRRLCNPTNQAHNKADEKMNAGTPPETINELFNQAMRERADMVVMRYKRDRRWHDITGAQLDERVRNLALALHRLGVRAGDRLALL